MNAYIKNDRSSIAIPVVSYNGIDSRVSKHFGNAPGFIVTDQCGSEFTYLDTAKARQASECAPVRSLASAGSKVVIACGMGRGAMQRCHAAGMRILHTTGGTTVAEVLEAYRRQACPDFPDAALCSHRKHRHNQQHHEGDCCNEEGN
jgi:predicted Fe-Mo cluster-binding NifX family protein